MPHGFEAETHLAPGYRLDRYELLCPIGAGGMASVWVARLQGKHGFEKLVAIKTILPRYACDPAFQKMFLDEARIAARIQHINVAQILDLGDHHGVLFLVMEWVEGDALSKLSYAVEEQRASFPPGIAVKILSDVCAGLHAAHELHDRSGEHLEVVHRDVSPHNILVDAQGVAKVIDFGIAKARDRAAGDTKTGSFKGKVKYMSPEQAVAPKSTDRRADIWAVGAVLYTLLAGRSPYESDNDMATLVQLAQERPPPPLPPELPEPIRKVVSRALAWDPANRYATAAEMREALDAAMLAAGMPTSSADVAAFSKRYLADRVNARQRAISIALSAAEERVRVERLLTPEETGDRRILRPSQPTVVEHGSGVKGSENLVEAAGRGSETSPTLGTAASMTFNLPIPRRRTEIFAAALLVALVGGTVTLLHRSDPNAHGGGTESSVGARPPEPVIPAAVTTPAAPPASATPDPTPPSPPPSVAPPAATTTAVAPTPARHPARKTESNSASTRPAPSPSPPSTTKQHRAEYGF
jgi:serine/threonine protein kinase